MCVCLFVCVRACTYRQQFRKTVNTAASELGFWLYHNLYYAIITDLISNASLDFVNFINQCMDLLVMSVKGTGKRLKEAKNAIK